MERVISVAMGEVGYLEKASRDNLYSKTANAGIGNYTKYAEDMIRYHPGIFANGYAWCDTFVDWCFATAYGEEGALGLLHGWSAYTPTSAGYFKNHGQWHREPHRGDVVFFKDKNGVICHTGIVCSVEGGYIETVEGNTSSKAGVVANGGTVAAKKYTLSNTSIAGYGRPDYSIVKREESKKEIVREDISPKEEISVYKTLEDCPRWARKYVEEALESGYIKGTPEGELNLDDTRIWCLVVMLRIAGIMN